MRNILYITMLFLIFTIGFGCKKDMALMDTASIIGGDPRAGACEGGTYIRIDGHPNPNDWANGYFDIGSLPSSFRIDNSAHYPINVKINWATNPKCGGNYVDIKRIELVY